MKKSATEVMQEIMFAAVIDAVMALKTASKGLPNNLLRDLNAIHANTTLADLPAELQTAIATSVRTAFSRLLKEGYSVGEGSAPPRPPRPPGSSGPPPRPHRRPPPKRDGDAPRRDGFRPPRKGGGPRKPGPR